MILKLNTTSQTRRQQNLERTRIINWGETRVRKRECESEESWDRRGNLTMNWLYVWIAVWLAGCQFGGARQNSQGGPRPNSKSCGWRHPYSLRNHTAGFSPNWETINKLVKLYYIILYIRIILYYIKLYYIALKRKERKEESKIKSVGLRQHAGLNCHLFLLLSHYIIIVLLFSNANQINQAALVESFVEPSIHQLMRPVILIFIITFNITFYIVE